MLSLFKNIKRPQVDRSPEVRRLHIGGEKAKLGWEILNAAAVPTADHIGNAVDLSRFPNECFAEIYASHVLEHLDFKKELQSALREWFRALANGGRLSVSVPDLDTLARLLIREDLSLDQRFHVVKMIFGAHSNEYDYHKVGLNFDFLNYFLKEAGFINIERVTNFGLFDDTSGFIFAGTPISLNIIAFKPE